MANYPTLNDVQIGREVNSPKHGKGIVSKKTARTVTVIFEKVTIKNTYKNKDSYFWDTDF